MAEATGVDFYNQLLAAEKARQLAAGGGPPLAVPPMPIPQTDPATLATQGLRSAKKTTVTSAGTDAPRTVEEANTAATSITDSAKKAVAGDTVVPLDLTAAEPRQVSEGTNFAAAPSSLTAVEAGLNRPLGEPTRSGPLRTPYTAKDDSISEKLKEFVTNPAVPMAALFGMGFFAGGVNGMSGLAQGFARGMAAMGEGISVQREREMAENTQDIAQQKANTEQTTAAASLGSAEREKEAKLKQSQTNLGLEADRIRAQLGIAKGSRALEAAKLNLSNVTDEKKLRAKLLEAGWRDALAKELEDIKFSHDTDPKKHAVTILLAASRAAELSDDKEATLREMIDFANKHLVGFEGTVLKPVKPEEKTIKEEPIKPPGFWKTLASYMTTLPEGNIGALGLTGRALGAKTITEHLQEATKAGYEIKVDKETGNLYWQKPGTAKRVWLDPIEKAAVERIQAAQAKKSGG